VQRRVQGVTRERMLREMTEAFEILSAETLWCWCWKTCHWSDPSGGRITGHVRRAPRGRTAIDGSARIELRNSSLLSTPQTGEAGIGRAGAGRRNPPEFSDVERPWAYVAQRLPEGDEALINFVYPAHGRPARCLWWQMTDYWRTRASPALWLVCKRAGDLPRNLIDRWRLTESSCLLLVRQQAAQLRVDSVRSEFATPPGREALVRQVSRSSAP